MRCIYLLPFCTFNESGTGGVFRCEQGPLLFQLLLERGGVVKRETINLPIPACVPSSPSIWDRGLPDMCRARPAYASLDVDIPRSICHLPLKRTRAACFRSETWTSGRSPSHHPSSFPQVSVRTLRCFIRTDWGGHLYDSHQAYRFPCVRVPMLHSGCAWSLSGSGRFTHSMPSHSRLHQPGWLTWAFTCAPIYYHVWPNMFIMIKIWLALHPLQRSKHKRGFLHRVSIGTLLKEQTNCTGLHVFSLGLLGF